MDTDLGIGFLLHARFGRAVCRLGRVESLGSPRLDSGATGDTSIHVDVSVIDDYPLALCFLPAHGNLCIYR